MLVGSPHFPWEGELRLWESHVTVPGLGTSFLLALEFTEEGVHADALLTYGESEHASSPYLSDQLTLYSNKTWRKVLFSPSEIAQDPNLQVSEVQGLGELEQRLAELRD